MEKNIVFIDDSESFIVRSIVKNLERMGYCCLITGWDAESIRANSDNFSSLVFAYINDFEEADRGKIPFLGDFCKENGCRLYLIGYEEEVREIRSEYGLEDGSEDIYRPVNASEAAERIGSLMTDNPMIHRKHILVVDDSGVMLTTIQEWLGKKYRVSLANSAMNAIAFLAKTLPDLILLDYEMPGCSGPQLLEMLRADIRTKEIPVIFLTGKDDPESVKRVLSLKPAGYLLKVMPKEHIIRQVDEFFE